MVLITGNASSKSVKRVHVATECQAVQNKQTNRHGHLKKINKINIVVAQNSAFRNHILFIKVITLDYKISKQIAYLVHAHFKRRNISQA